MFYLQNKLIIVQHNILIIVQQYILIMVQQYILIIVQHNILKKVLLALGGYSWTVIPVDKRDDYM